MCVAYSFFYTKRRHVQNQLGDPGWLRGPQHTEGYHLFTASKVYQNILVPGYKESAFIVEKLGDNYSAKSSKSVSALLGAL